MPERYPAVEPYDSGWLDVGDGHQIYWECSGKPTGWPGLLLHGGPGSGCAPGGRRREVEWVTEGVGRVFPREWERFAAAVPARLRDRPLVDAYAELLVDPDPAVCEAAARAWCAWEDAHVSLAPGSAPSLRFADPEFRLCFARLVTHYWRHAAFLPADHLLHEAGRLDGIPGVLIHGAHDVSSPLETPWELAKRWRTSRLVVLERSGHVDAMGFPSAIVEALDGFASGY